MSEHARAVLLLVLAVLLVSLQTTVLSPSRLGALSPDLNLALTVVLAVTATTRAEVALGLLNGLLLDALSGLPLGAVTLSRASVFILVRSLSLKLFLRDNASIAVLVAFASVYVWGFVWLAFLLTGKGLHYAPAGVELARGLSTSLFSLPLTWVVRKHYAYL